MKSCPEKSRMCADAFMEARFWEKVGTPSEPGGCWEWNGTLRPDGYGSFKFRGRTLVPHRVMVIGEYGVFPDDLVVDHACRNRRCVNPEHLCPVTLRENNLNGVSPPAEYARRGECMTCGWEMAQGKKQRYCPVCREVSRRVRAIVKARGLA